MDYTWNEPGRLAIEVPDGDGDLDAGVFSPGVARFITIRNDLTPPHSADRDRNGIPDECVPPAPRFRRGDTNADGAVDISDAIATLGFLFLGNIEKLACDKSADTNDDGKLDLSDAVALLSHLFLGAPAPPQPFDACGLDPTDDGLGCALFAPCQ